MIENVVKIPYKLYKTFTTPGMSIKEKPINKDIKKLTKKDFEIKKFNHYIKTSIKLTSLYNLSSSRFYIIGIGEIALNIAVLTFMDLFKEESNKEIMEKKAEETQSSKIDCQQTLSFMLINLALRNIIFNNLEKQGNSLCIYEMLTAYIYISYIFTRCATKFENLLVNEKYKKENLVNLR